MFAETEVARDILKQRYYAPGESAPEELLTRVASYVAEPEEHKDLWTKRFYDIMSKGLFLPNSPCLVNAGRGGGLFACFVLGMEDTLESISKAKADAMAITKAGGGWGIFLGSLRPRGARVKGSTHGVAGGPVGFWETFSYDMRTMTQGGFRDAACMATMSVDHPDTMEFMRAKSPINSICRLLNLDSIVGPHEAEKIAESLLDMGTIRAASETFMSNFNISLLATDRFMRIATDKGSIKKIPTGFGGEESWGIYPKHLLEEVAQGMWENGEPGLLFIDTIRERTRYEPGSINATNPCGEQALPPNGSCCLGSINLAAHVKDGKFDFRELGTTVTYAVRFLDNMITQNVFPTKETEEWSLHNRAIGLGVMGWADTLALKGIPYDSEEAVQFAERISFALRSVAELTSQNLYNEKGGHDWDGRRNRALLSIAPTGTLSLLAGCSPSVEPPYRDSIIRSDNTGKHLIRYPLSDMAAFRTVDMVDPEYIIRHVAAFSKYVDNSVSYTVNVSNNATPQEIRDLIIFAWESKCNGITVYRDGSRVRQVLNGNSVLLDLSQIQTPEERKRPLRLEGHTDKYTANISGETKNVYVTVNEFNANPWEVFIHTPLIQSMLELQLVTITTRLTSLCLRNHIPIEDIVAQLRKVEGQSLLSIPAIIANALMDYTEIGESCPDCGSELVFSGGCSSCQNCGYSTCG